MDSAVIDLPVQGLPAVPSRLLTVQEAAEYLNVPIRWLQDAVFQRRVRCIRIGRQIRFAAGDLEELLASGGPVVSSNRRRYMRSDRRRRQP